MVERFPDTITVKQQGGVTQNSDGHIITPSPNELTTITRYVADHTMYKITEGGLQMDYKGMFICPLLDFYAPKGTVEFNGKTYQIALYIVI